MWWFILELSSRTPHHIHSSCIIIFTLVMPPVTTYTSGTGELNSADSTLASRLGLKLGLGILFTIIMLLLFTEDNFPVWHDNYTHMKGYSPGVGPVLYPFIHANPISFPLFSYKHCHANKRLHGMPCKACTTLQKKAGYSKKYVCLAQTCTVKFTLKFEGTYLLCNFFYNLSLLM